MQFGADADIYIDKKRLHSDACNINQWTLYNSTADTYIKLSKYAYKYTYQKGMEWIILKT